MERGGVDDQQLTQHRPSHRQNEGLVGEEADGEERLGVRARAEGIEHVEEDEAREGHGGVSPGHLLVTHLPPEDPQRAHDDDGG